jgi:hypothetical protein
MKKQSMFKKSIKQSLIFSGILGFIAMNILMLYNAMDTVFERIAVAILGVGLLVPMITIIVVFLFNLVLGSLKLIGLDSNGKGNESNAKTPKSIQEPNTVADKHKLKVVTTDGYMEFSNVLKASVKNKLMSRQCILQLKSELIYKLGTHIEVYKNFEFKNDMHEIYTLSKSSVLTKADYQYLTEFISNNLILPKEA